MCRTRNPATVTTSPINLQERQLKPLRLLHPHLCNKLLSTHQQRPQLPHHLKASSNLFRFHRNPDHQPPNPQSLTLPASTTPAASATE